MSRFASTKLREIDLGDGEWVKIPTALSYEIVMKFSSIEDSTELSKEMLSTCIKEWNMKDEDGVIPELNMENIMKLDIQTVSLISSEIAKLMRNDQDKKK